MDGCGRGLNGVFRRKRRKPVGGRFFGGHGVTFNSASVNGEVDDLADLDAIVGPQTIGFPKDGYGATVLDGYPGQRILRYHFVKVDQSFSIFRLTGRCLRSSIPIVRVSAFEPAGAVWFEMSIRQEKCLPFLCLHLCYPIFSCPGSNLPFAYSCGAPLTGQDLGIGVPCTFQWPSLSSWGG